MTIFFYSLLKNGNCFGFPFKNKTLLVLLQGVLVELETLAFQVPLVLCTDLFCFNKLPSRRSTLTHETRAKGSVYVDERENSFCLTCVLIQNTCILFCFMDFNDYFRFRFKTFDRENEDKNICPNIVKYWGRTKR